MSIFNIKLKTRNGNDVKKRETITIFFRLNFKKGLKTTAEYTYRIIYSKGVKDPQVVLALKNSQEVESLEDLTLKVMLNLCHIIGIITKVENISPDFINFISPDFGGKNKSWRYLIDAFKKKKPPQEDGLLEALITSLDVGYEENWSEDKCNKMKIKKEELDLLKAFTDLNPNTVFMTIDPMRDSEKYAKSISICNQLKDRIDRNLQMTG